MIAYFPIGGVNCAADVSTALQQTPYGECLSTFLSYERILGILCPPDREGPMEYKDKGVLGQSQRCEEEQTYISVGVS